MGLVATEREVGTAVVLSAELTTNLRGSGNEPVARRSWTIYNEYQTSDFVAGDGQLEFVRNNRSSERGFGRESDVD